MNCEEIQVVQSIYEHQQKVGAVMLKVINELIHRALTHDASKFTTQQLRDNLVTLPDKWKIQEAGHGYHSPEQGEHRKRFAQEIHRHRSAHPHHPEHFGNDVNKMNLIDLMEMLCDWYVASPDIDQSIHENSRDYKIDPHISQILKNTARKLKEIVPIEEEESITVSNS